MITSVRLGNFKNFADETLHLGPFTVIVGANASGKSNIRDAFRFLHGIGREYTLAEILGGKYGADWKPLRGAPNEIMRFGQPYPDESPAFSIDVALDMSWGKVSYSVTVGFNPRRPDGFQVLWEELADEDGVVYRTAKPGDPGFLPNGYWVTVRGHTNPTGHNPATPGLNLLAWRGGQWSVLKLAFELSRVFNKMRFLEFSPERMREPSIPGSTILGDSGENLPSVLEAICADSGRERTLMSWLQELTPMDVKDFDFPRDPSGRVHLHIVERNGRKVSAYSASDGTLRFLGILAALLSPHEGGLYFFEEIDNGIHPNRLWLLLDLIEQQTAKGQIQVITTTHSPALLAWMNDTTFEHTSVVYRDEYWIDSVIRPIAGLYNLRELRKSQGLERLLTNGWFETAMKFSEGDPDTDHLDDDEDDWEQGVLQ